MCSAQVENSFPSTVREDFEAAITRICEHIPLHPILVKKMRAGTLKLSLSAVALESGHSRTLITGSKCQYPEIRDRITALIKSSPYQASETSKRTIQDLRNENTDLKAQLALIATQYAAAFQKNRDLEARLNNEINRVQMLLATNDQRPHLILKTDNRKTDE